MGVSKKRKKSFPLGFSKSSKKKFPWFMKLDYDSEYFFIEGKENNHPSANIIITKDSHIFPIVLINRETMIKYPVLAIPYRCPDGSMLCHFALLKADQQVRDLFNKPKITDKFSLSVCKQILQSGKLRPEKLKNKKASLDNFHLATIK